MSLKNKIEQEEGQGCSQRNCEYESPRINVTKKHLN